MMSHRKHDLEAGQLFFFTSVLGKVGELVQITSISLSLQLFSSKMRVEKIT